MIRSEKDVINNVVKLWGVVMSLFAGSFFTKTFTLSDIDIFLGAMNISLYFIVAIYSVYCTMVSIKECKAFVCTFATFSGGLLCLTMAILQICWFNVDQILVTWINLCWTSTEFATGLYIGFIINMIHNTKIEVLQKECKSDIGGE